MVGSYNYTDVRLKSLASGELRNISVYEMTEPEFNHLIEFFLGEGWDCLGYSVERA